MPTWLSWILAFAKGVLGIKQDAAVANAKEAGAATQALKDQEAVNAITSEAAAAASAGDQRRVLERNAPADTRKPDPDLPYRD